MIKLLSAFVISSTIGCGGGSTAPATAPTTPTPPAASMTQPPAGGAKVNDNFCDVVAQVMTAAQGKFAGVEHATITGAKSAAVSPGPVTASWTATWATTETPDAGLATMRARVAACPFASRLVGGKAHATEKGGKLTAIDWTDAQTKSGLEVVSEGGGEVSVSVVPN